MINLTDTDIKRLELRKEAIQNGEKNFHEFYSCLPISSQRQWETYDDAKFYCFETSHYSD